MSHEISESDRIKLDTPTIESRGLLYPEPLREPHLWLCSYLRDECNRNLDVLLERAHKLGISMDKTNWSKIIRGKWNRDAENKECPPCVALDKALRFIEMLRRDARIKEMSGQIAFVETSTTRQIFDFIDIKRTPDRVNKMGIVIGETGTQKSAAFREYQRQNNHGTTGYVDAPEMASMVRFKNALALAYGCSPRASMIRKEEKIAESLNDRKTLIIENVQRLYIDREEGNQPVFNYLQLLQERTRCAMILSFTPTFEAKFVAGVNKGFFEQFVGRAGGIRRFLRLDAYPPEEDVEAIADAFKVKGLKDTTTWLGGKQPEKVTVLEYLVRIAHEPGRIRRLFEDLQDAKIEAEATKKSLSIDLIKDVRGEEE